jgi:hypothetical protein
MVNMLTISKDGYFYTPLVSNPSSNTASISQQSPQGSQPEAQSGYLTNTQNFSSGAHYATGYQQDQQDVSMSLDWVGLVPLKYIAFTTR